MQESERPIEIVREEAFSKATRVRAEDEIDINLFKDLYGETQLQYDASVVAEYEQQFSEKDTPELREGRKIATIFDGIWHDQASKGWLGRDATAMTPTKYDDYKNGIDSVVEFKTGPRAASQLALGIDLTFFNHPGEKLERVTYEINKGRLAEVKYFNSEHLGFTGKLRNVPRVVVGIEISQVNRLAAAWTGSAEGQASLREDPIQIVILDEIKMQLVAFKKYAQVKGKANLVPYYERVEKLVDGLLKEKTELRTRLQPQIEDIKKKDRVYRALEVFLKNLPI